MKRITSIDALRAFALLGILLIHARHGFGVSGCHYLSKIDLALGGGCKFLLESRCMLIFNILFGVSFFIILGKKDYPASKFVWRCFLLVCIGLINRLGFNSDVLFKYGLCGMALVLIRNLSNKRIIIFSIVFIIIGVVLQWLEFGSIIQIPSRYVKGGGVKHLLTSYPISLLGLAKQFLNGDFFIIFANMAIGYVLGRVGFIESMDKKLTFKQVVISLVLYCILGFIYYGCVYYRISVHPLLNKFVLNLFYYCGAAFYWLLFIWLYNHVKWFHELSLFFESYGKCGLTNYSMQGFIGIIIFYFLEIGYLKLPFTILFVYSIFFFVLQMLFSFFWLKKYKNGPFEYLWRCATERK